MIMKWYISFPESGLGLPSLKRAPFILYALVCEDFLHVLHQHLLVLEVVPTKFAYFFIGFSRNFKFWNLFSDLLGLVFSNDSHV